MKLTTERNIKCGKKISIPKLINHIEEHKFSVSNTPSLLKSNLTLREDDFNGVRGLNLYWKTSHLQFHGKHFFGNYKLNVKDKLLNIWVYQLGTSEETKNYYATITVNRDDEEKIIFKSQVSSIDLSETEVFESGAAFICPFITVKRFVKTERLKIDIELDYVWSRHEKINDILAQCKFNKHGCTIEQEGVNFTNIFHATFMHECVLLSFSLVTIRLCNFLVQKYWQKSCL